MKLMRSSKVKHVYGQANKREDCFDGIRITKNSWDSTFCSVSAKFLAVITESAGGGAFLVIPINKTGRIEPQAMPLITGHKAPVLDIQWSPHDDNVIASASEDCTLKVWRIPDGGIPEKTSITEAEKTLVAHQRRVGLVVWHPTVKNVLFSAGADFHCYLWDVENEEILADFEFPEMITSASFNSNGSLIVTSCKDKFTRILNPRTRSVVHQLQCHEGTKPQQCTFLMGDQFVTTGFSRMSERQVAVWEMSDLSKPKALFELDNTNGTLFPFYDRDLNLLYLCGKGDSVIRYFEIVQDNVCIYPISQYKSSVAQRGFGWLPKRAVNTSLNEVGRLFRLHQTGFCEVIPFIIPRKSELFQDDLFPDCVGDQPALSLDEWLAGEDREPGLVSMRPESESRAAPKRAVSCLAPSGVKPRVRPVTCLGELQPEMRVNSAAELAHNNSSNNNSSGHSGAANLHAAAAVPNNASISDSQTEVKKLQAVVAQLQVDLALLANRVDCLEKLSSSSTSTSTTTSHSKQSNSAGDVKSSPRASGLEIVAEVVDSVEEVTSQ